MADLSGSRLIINNEVIPFMANSLRKVMGHGERRVYPQEIGGGEVEVIDATDLSTKVGKVTFDLKSTDENQERLRVWKSNGNANSIRIESSSGVTTDIFNKQSCTTDPEIDTGVDGIISIEFQGKSAQ